MNDFIWSVNVSTSTEAHKIIFREKHMYNFSIIQQLAFSLPSRKYSISNYTVKPLICRTLVGNKIVDNSDVVGASPVGAAPTTSSFST